jgi:hypothetical protein
MENYLKITCDRGNDNHVELSGFNGWKAPADWPDSVRVNNLRHLIKPSAFLYLLTLSISHLSQQ